MVVSVLRFAPSPTGLLHIGNLRTALLNWMFARERGGEVVLRFDDTDPERCEESYVQAIRDDLAWAGLIADREARQSARADAHDEAFERLRGKGLVYPCYESAEELERKRKVLLARRRPPVYDRAALRLSDAERDALEAEGRFPHWRFRLPSKRVQWLDLVCGEQNLSTASLSDPVLRREDGHYLYMLPSVVDDISMSITHIIRGADHLTNTAVQLCLFEALGEDAPVFAHHSLLLDADGSKLSKRLAGLSLSQLRSDGIEPAALTSLLARLGSSENPKLMRSVEELAKSFSLSNFSRAPARFDTAVLEALNSKLLHEMNFADAKPRLEALGIAGGENFWNGVRGNLARFDDAIEWWRCIAEPLDPTIDVAEDGSMLEVARDRLPSEPWSESTYDEWIVELKRATGRSGRKLFLPLRLALTGKSHGPELQVLLSLLGRAKASARLSGKRA